MAVYYSAVARGFYDTRVNERMPDDALEIPDEIYQSLLTGQSQGKVITEDDDGFPVLTEAPSLTVEELLAKGDMQRNQLIDAARETIGEWQTELQLGILGEDDRKKLTEWLSYIRKLKGTDLLSVQSDSDYKNIAWPVPPAANK